MTKNENNSNNWHLETVSETIATLHSSEEGLSKEEALKRLTENGPNILPEEKGIGVVGSFFAQFKSPLIYVLLICSVIVSTVGDLKDGLIIIFVLFINALIGAFQEGKARNTLKSLKDFSKGKAVVIRDGKETEIEDSNIVVGDCLVVRSGDKIGADARIISSGSLKMNESSLTGESELVEKEAEQLFGIVEVSDRKNMLFKGSLAVVGLGNAIVVAVAENTVIGAISKKLQTIESEMPLKKKIKVLSKIIGLSVLGAAVFVILIGLARGIPIKEIFFAATAISVSLIPEGLPVVITLILAKGVYRMAKRNALVKNMQAVEALGQANILAVDKTGTITKNELMVNRVYVDGKVFEVLGGGYDPKGDILLHGKAVDPANHPELLFSGKVACFCADASVEFLENNEIKVLGDPTEAALLTFGEKTGFKKEELENEEPKVFEIPFGFKHKFHTTLHRERDGEFFLTVVGAPEVILSKVKTIWTSSGPRDISETDFFEMDKKMGEFAKMGLRLLAFAVLKTKSEAIDIDHIEGLSLGGLFGMNDVLREEVPELVNLAYESGIKTVMITGDFMGTGKAIAKIAGIWKEGDTAATGAEISSWSKEEMDRKIEDVSVFARVSPENKLSIVESYKRRGDIIGMTGDGVNDALSLSAAHLGIGMGIGGTEVAREASDIILLDNNFKSIIAAVEEGRSIYKTIKKVVLYLISTSLGEFLTISLALILNLPLPISPTQILWLNLITDGLLVVALAFEPNESLDGNQKGKKNHTTAIVGGQEIFRAFIMGVVMALGSILVFSYAYMKGSPAVWTLSLTVLAVFQWFNVWNCRSEKKSAFSKPFSNPYLVLALLVTVAMHLFAIYNPFMQNLLNTKPLSIYEWGALILIASSVMVVEEIRKFFARIPKKPIKKQHVPTQ